MDDAASASPGTRSTGPDRPSSESLSALYLRVADTLDRSAELAEHHAERLRSKGQALAGLEFERARRARKAARRGRELAARLR
jgi:hypothetical protein